SRSSGSIPTTTTPTSRTCSSSSWIGSTRQSEPDRCRSRSVRAPPTSPSQTVIKPPRICPEITRPGLFVSSIGSTPGNVLIAGTAAGTATNLLALLTQPQTTTANGVALSAPNQQLVSYLSFALVGTTLTVSSNN